MKAQKFAYPSKFGQKAKFVYNKLSEIAMEMKEHELE